MEHSSSLNKASRGALECFAELLLKWNPHLNLISRRDVDDLWFRHIEDSLQLLPLLPTATDHAIDLGSGGGFPGLVLSIASGVRFELVEADHRKAAFLREAIRLTDAPATVHCTRIEDVILPPAPLVTARALAPLPILLGLVAPKLAISGVALLPKGAGYASELTAARREWQMHVEAVPSRTAPAAAILRIGDLRRVHSAP